MMSRQKFETLVSEGIDAIPEEFAAKLSNVAVVVADEPTSAQRHELKLRAGWTLFGLYEGVPQSGRQNYSGALPDKITIFQRPIEEAAASIDEVREIVTHTVWHEIAHHFGMDESRVRAAEAARRQRS